MTWKPKPTTREIELPAEDRRLAEVRDFVTRAAEELGFAGRALANIRLAVDEACTNVVRHAYAGGTGTLRVRVATRRRWLEIRVHDQGQPFDGRVEIPHLGRWVDTKRKGGLGVFLMHRLMDEVRYETTPAGNEWILRKRLQRTELHTGSRTSWRYGARAALVLGLLSAGVALPLCSNAGRTRERVDEQALRAHAHGLVEAARPALLGRAELSPEQTHLFEAVHALVRREPRLLSVTVVDRDGTIWASDRSVATFTRFRAPALGPPDAEGVRRIEERIEGEPVLHWSAPVGLAGREDLGAVYLSLRWGPTRAAIRAARLQILLAVLLVDVVLSFAVVLFVGRILGPLQRLLDGLRSAGPGDSDLAVDGPEAIGAIASAFNEIHARYRAAAATAVEHARLQEEMHLARDIQASILPQSLPAVPGYELARLYEPAQQVGGDYYDFLDAGPGLTGIVVADVAGKGVPGSLVMGMVRTALRMETRSNAHAGDVLARLHAFLSPDLRRGMFVTMLYVVLDARNGVVSYASAGHTPLLLFRAATGDVRRLEPRGIPVGLAGSDARAFARELDVERVRLQEGDVLLLYTDGITEARSESGEEFGEERLAAALGRWGRGPAAELLQHLTELVREWTGTAGGQDDRTVVAVRQGQPAAGATGEVQRKLFELVERRGLSPAAAAGRLGLSPGTYYRLKRLQEIETPPERDSERLHPAPPEAAPAVEARADSGAEEVDGGGLRGRVELNVSGWVTIVLEGAADSSTCGVVEALLARGRALGSRLLVDLSGTAYVSSRGWGLLAATAAGLRPSGELALCGMRPPLREVYRMLGFATAMRTFEDAAQAATALGAAPQPGRAPEPPPSPGPDPAPAIEARVESWESLRVQVAPAAGNRAIALVALAGILDTVSAARLRTTFDELVGSGARDVLVDLSCLEFASSAGWGCFTAPIEALRARGGDLRLFGMNAALGRVFGLLGLGAVLQRFDVLTDALASFGVEAGATAPTAAAGASAAGSHFRHQDLEAWWEPMGTTERLHRLVLRGTSDAASAMRLRSWIEETSRGGRVLVDATELTSATPRLWRALGCALAARGIPAAARSVAGARPAVAPPAPFAPGSYATGLEALRGLLVPRIQPLARVRLPDIEFERDAELRRDGWGAYRDLLHEGRSEDAA